MRIRRENQAEWSGASKMKPLKKTKFRVYFTPQEFVKQKHIARLGSSVGKKIQNSFLPSLNIVWLSKLHVFLSLIGKLRPRSSSLLNSVCLFVFILGQNFAILLHQYHFKMFFLTLKYLNSIYEYKNQCKHIQVTWNQ